MSDAPALRAGWEPDCPPGDTLLRDYVVGWRSWFVDLAEAQGQRLLLDEDVVLVLSGLPSIFLNGGVVLRPFGAGAPAERVVERVVEFFAGFDVPYALFSPWPTPDLRQHGFTLVGHPPWMVRPAGGTAPPSPPGLRIEEVRDRAGLRAAERVLTLGFQLDGLDGVELYGPEVLEIPDVHFFVGYEADEPVATAAGHVSEGIQHVENVATRPEWRSRGYGEAVTWRATLLDRAKPAGLVASDPGRPVYERMGYVAMTRFTLWAGASAD